MVCQRLVRVPEIDEVGALDANNPRARAVFRRHEDQVADHERRGGVDRRGDARAPGTPELNLAGGGIESDERRARQKDRETLAANRGARRRRIAALVIAGGPQDLSALGIEGDDAGAAAADVRDDAAVLDERRPGAPEEALLRAEALPRVLAPYARALREIDRVQLTFGAERVHDAVNNDRRRARPLVEPEVVAIRGGIRVSPLLVAGARIE